MPRHAARLVVCCCALLAAAPASAVNLVIDYTYDTSNFFGANNPDGAAAGAQAAAAVEAAAAFYTDLLEDSFTGISTPAPFFSQQFNGSVTWQWTHSFSNPSTGSTAFINDDTFAADEYRVYVGARSLGGSTLGRGGPGGFGWSSTPSGGFTSEEIDQLNQITDDFSNAVTTRGETSGFARWGGAMTFDSDSSTNWHYDHTTQPSSGESDLFSVALHELGHVVGIGLADQWDTWVNTVTEEYSGPASVAEFGGNVPLDCDPFDDGCAHWAEGVSSTVYGTSITQETLMDPTVTQGTRKLLTTLDAASLTDIGWTVAPPPTFAEADYDQDGDVDADDLTRWGNWFTINGNGDADGDGDTDLADVLVWQKQYTGTITPITPVPEPAAATLIVVAAFLRGTRRNRDLTIQK
ncbi:MAG: hypothetical protein AAGA92_10385 [Planctomycetota bacterium]